MSNREIQITFPKPGEWGRFTMVAVYAKDGFRYQDVYSAADVPQEMSGAFAGVVRALVGLAAPWQAYHVNVRAVTVTPDADPENVGEGQTMVGPYDVLVLTVYAQNEAGGRRTFTARDYPEFTIADQGAVEFFNYFTKPE